MRKPTAKFRIPDAVQLVVSIALIALLASTIR